MRSCSNTGVNEINNLSDITVFPNPAKDKLMIGCPQKSGIEILNTEGQILLRLTAIDIHTMVNLSTLSAGIYVIKVKTEEGITVKKIIKQ